MTGDYDHLDLLINNAGVMAVPNQRTADGFEMQFGTNHLGHFAFTGSVLARLTEVEGSRIVNVSSNAHKFGKIDFTDLNWERKYSPWRAYGQSKLANLLFTYELQRRLTRAEVPTIAVACHPGGSRTNLGDRARRDGRSTDGDCSARDQPLHATRGDGCAPHRASRDRSVGRGWRVLRPGRLRRAAGLPGAGGVERPIERHRGRGALWSVSEELTGVAYGIDP